MSNGDGYFTMAVLGALLVCLLMASCRTGRDLSRGEFRACRLLLQTADSATVLATKPECERWTLPVKTEKP